MERLNIGELAVVMHGNICPLLPVVTKEKMLPGRMMQLCKKAFNKNLLHGAAFFTAGCIFIAPRKLEAMEEDNKPEESRQLQKFQVSIHFEMDDQFMTYVPPHRTYIDYLIRKGKVESYTVSIESEMAWILVNAADTHEVESILRASPLYKYWTYEIHHVFVADGRAFRLPALQYN